MADGRNPPIMQQTNSKEYQYKSKLPKSRKWLNKFTTSRNLDDVSLKIRSDLFSS